MAEIGIGAYVLATKFEDGEPGDHWAVGFYRAELPSIACHDRRYMVVDADGVPFRANGFRRIAVITREEGDALIARRELIEESSATLWEWLEAIRGNVSMVPKAATIRALREASDRLCSKAAEDIGRWEMQAPETLALCMVEELGEIARALHDLRPAKGDIGALADRLIDESIDLGALCVQMLVLCEAVGLDDEDGG